MTINLPLPAPAIDRVRHTLKRRDLTVSAIERVTPAMLRVSLTGDDASDFISLAPDDHIKIFLPSEAGEERRDYTPRRYHGDTNTIVIDFAVHEAGPATRWALDAQIGDTLSIGGPRGSAVVSPDVVHWLLVGDETALPAIGRRIEEAPIGVNMTALIAVTGPQEEQAFSSAAHVKTLWAHRPLSSANDAAPLLSLLKEVDIPAGTFVWVAAEASVTRRIRTYLVEERGHPLSWTKAAGYWVKGRADAHEKFD